MTNGNMKRFAIILSIAALAVSCFQGKESTLGPGETVEAFHKALYSGEFEQAKDLCDTLAMGEYIDAYRTVWEQNGTSVAEIVSDIMSETEIKITDIKKDGQNRAVFYELTFEGRSKAKTAGLRNEEGAWKIERITDID